MVFEDDDWISAEVDWADDGDKAPILFDNLGICVAGVYNFLDVDDLVVVVEAVVDDDGCFLWLFVLLLLLTLLVTLDVEILEDLLTIEYSVDSSEWIAAKQLLVICGW